MSVTIRASIRNTLGPDQMSFAGTLAISVGYIILKHRAWDSRPSLPPPPTYLVPAVVTVIYFSDFFSLRLSEVLYQVSVVYRIGTHPYLAGCSIMHEKLTLPHHLTQSAVT